MNVKNHTSNVENRLKHSYKCKLYFWENRQQTCQMCQRAHFKKTKKIIQSVLKLDVMTFEDVKCLIALKLWIESILWPACLIYFTHYAACVYVQRCDENAFCLSWWCNVMLGVFLFFSPQFVCFMISFCPVHNLNIVDNVDVFMFSIQHLPPVRLIFIYA